MRQKLLSGKNLMVLFISLIMVTSVIGFVSLSSFESEYTYNGYRFVQRADGYHVRVDRSELVFTALPGELSDANISRESAEALKRTRLIMTSSALNSSYAKSVAGAVYYLRNALAGFNVYVLNGFTEPTSLQSPVITCRNATAFVPVIVFEDSNVSEVVASGNCLSVRMSSPEYAARFAQSAVYAVAGIVEGQ